MTPEQLNKIINLINAIARGGENKIAELENELKQHNAVTLDAFYAGQTIAEFAIEKFLAEIRAPHGFPGLIIDAIDMIFNYASVNSLNKDKVPYLHLAVSQRAVNVKQQNLIEKLIAIFYKKKANFNIVDATRATAIHKAVFRKNFCLVEALHLYGCGINRVDNSNSTALDYIDKQHPDYINARVLGALSGDSVSRFHNAQIVNKLDTYNKPRSEALRLGKFRNTVVPEKDGKQSSFPWVHLAITADDHQMMAAMVEKNTNLNLIDDQFNVDGHASTVYFVHLAVLFGILYNSPTLLGVMCDGLVELRQTHGEEDALSMMIASGKLNMFLSNHSVRAAVQSYNLPAMIRPLLDIAAQETKESTHQKVSALIKDMEAGEAVSTAAPWQSPAHVAMKNDPDSAEWFKRINAERPATHKVTKAMYALHIKDGVIVRDQIYFFRRDMARTIVNAHLNMDFPIMYDVLEMRRVLAGVDVPPIRVLEGDSTSLDVVESPAAQLKADLKDQQKEAASPSKTVAQDPAQAAYNKLSTCINVPPTDEKKLYNNFKVALLTNLSDEKRATLAFPGNLKKLYLSIESVKMTETRKKRFDRLKQLLQKLLSDYPHLNQVPEIMEMAKYLNLKLPLASSSASSSSSAAGMFRQADRPPAADNKKDPAPSTSSSAPAQGPSS